MTPPTTIFYAETGGKTGPFYMALRGVKSALKTSWKGQQNRWAKDHGREPHYPEPKVYRGTVTWEEIDLDA